MSDKERYERLKAHGTCVQCGVHPAEVGKVRCGVCLEYIRKYDRSEYDRKYRNTIKSKFKIDVGGATRRDHHWELSIDQAGFYYTQPCYYCGESPNGKLNGIDRQDSSEGYTTENCVPCCTTCNLAKRQMSPDEFVWHCEKVAQYNKK